LDDSKVILSGKGLKLSIDRLCKELIENCENFENTAIIGLQPRGAHFSDILMTRLLQLSGVKHIHHGKLDITFHRDDFRTRNELIQANSTEINFLVENKKVILVDDVLYTGRSVRAGLDALLAFGRPSKVELLTLIDRRFSRDLPIEANYIGKKTDTFAGQKVLVKWAKTIEESEVTLYTPKNKK